MTVRPSAGNKSNARPLSMVPTIERLGCRGLRQAASNRFAGDRLWQEAG
jgi:hypothetical protein